MEFFVRLFTEPVVELERVKVFQCDNCLKVFTNTEKLSRHITSHAKVLEHMKSVKVLLKRVQIYQCKECPRCFLHYKTLNEHQEEHISPRKLLQQEDNNNELKPHKCNKCGWRFVERSTLTTHMKVHKPFPHVCHCGIGFWLFEDLSTHKNLVHSILQSTEPSIKSEIADKPKKNQKKIEDEKKPRLLCAKNNRKTKLNKHKGKWTYICDKCAFGCNILAKMILHKKIHEGDNEGWVCDFCKKVFRSKSNLFIHTLVHTKEKLYACTVCPKRFTQGGALKLHLNRHAGNYAFKCQHCTKRFITKGALCLHERTHTGFKPYCCKVCQKEFSDPSAFKRHERIHTGEKPYRCRYCPKAFSDNSAWLVHTRRHEGNTYSCNICKKQLSCSSSLHLHRERHKNLKYECDYCGVVKKSKHYLSRHIQFMHMNTKKLRYQCQYCQKMFYYKSVRNAHITNVHKSGKLNKCYDCPMCGQEFKMEIHMTNHIALTHWTNKHNECDHCKTRFSDKDSLRSHIPNCPSHPDYESLKTGSDIKRRCKTRFKLEITCPECPKQFWESTAMEKHRLEYHGTAFCGHCGEEFNGVRNLRNHIWSKHMLSLYCNFCLKRFYAEHQFRHHKSKGCTKNYKCRICQITLTKSAWETHLRTKHVIKCDTCMRSFLYKRSLIKHFKVIHGVGK